MIEKLNADGFTNNKDGISPIDLAKINSLTDVQHYLQNNVL
jgi:hypothetical protein